MRGSLLRDCWRRRDLFFGWEDGAGRFWSARVSLVGVSLGKIVLLIFIMYSVTAILQD